MGLHSPIYKYPPARSSRLWRLIFLICAITAATALADCVPSGDGLIGWWPATTLVAEPAVVTVALPPPAIRSPAWNEQTFSFTFDTFAGVLYIAEYSSAPAGATWTELDRRPGNGLPQSMSDTNLPPEPRFYRVRAVYPPPD
ncbi:MAG TPA: hypothetical protein VHH88_11155 [Verrucomicrobiae bacterium]|nr:hypothetical protein [Verrucomicrobiae bacterium]